MHWWIFQDMDPQSPCTTVIRPKRLKVFSHVHSPRVEAFQGVKATSDTTLKSSITGISNQQQSNQIHH